MSRAHARESMIERSGGKVLKLFIALILMQVVLVPLTWVAINYLFYGNLVNPLSFPEWSMTASFEALFVLQSIVTVAMVGVWWAVAALRNHLALHPVAREVRSSTPFYGPSVI